MHEHIESVFRSLRTKEPLNPDKCTKVLVGHGPSGAGGTPLDYLRAEVKDDDLVSIVHALHQAAADRDEPFRVAIHLLQGLLMTSKELPIKARVRGIREGAWPAARRKQNRGRAVAAALVSIDDLADETHEDMYRFLVDNWETGRTYTETLMGGAGRIAPWISSRLTDHRWPASKTWVYVLILGLSDKPNEVAKIIKALPDEIDVRPPLAAILVCKKLDLVMKL